MLPIQALVKFNGKVTYVFFGGAGFLLDLCDEV